MVTTEEFTVDDDVGYAIISTYKDLNETIGFLVYGYTAENRHMVQAFLAGRMPDENWHDGLAVTEVLMACYKSAEEGRTIAFPTELGDFIPAVARGTWRP